MTLDLVKVSDYGLEGKNWYFVNAEKFNMSYEELAACGVLDEEAYLNRGVCEKLQLLNQELHEKYGLKLIIKDAYRSVELYKLIIKKRTEKEGAEFVEKSFNTKGDFPHSTGNTLDVSFVDIATGEQLKCVKEIEDLQERRESWATHYYENRIKEDEQEIHKNRIFMQEMLDKYGFEGISHEYWHFNLR